VILDHRLGILNNKEISQLNEHRKLRNCLVHVKADKLARMAMKRYKGSGLNHSHLNAGPYLYSFGKEI
jgi:hypothetical protein